VFGECEALPAMAFPFVALFGADDVGAFEALASIFVNVLPGWFELFPNPPMHVIAVAEVRASASARGSALCAPLICAHSQSFAAVRQLR
jgi:hypothetical protein